MQLKSFDTESGCEDLVDEFQEKLVSMFCDNQEEACLEIEDIEA